MQPKTVLESVFESFIAKLRESGKVESPVVNRLEELLKKRQVKADVVKQALFAEENLP